jgi:Cytochrome P460
MKTALYVTCCVWAVVAIVSPSVSAQQAAAPPAFTSAGQLVRPIDYRSWVFVTSGLGMTYGPAKPAAGQPPLFDNVFVTREAYAAFLRSGAWPDKTMFILEGRRAETNVSINNGGHTQGDVAFMEAAVKDTARFASTGGWGYFSFDSRNGLVESAAPLPSTASCYACHSANTAVDNTFVQFYPELFAVAKAKGTVKATYDPSKKP